MLTEPTFLNDVHVKSHRKRRTYECWKCILVQFSFFIMSIARLQPSLGFSSSSSDKMPPTSFLTREDGNKIAYLHYNPPAPHNKGESKNQKPGILFCPGFQSNMHGSKSHTLLSYCISHNYEYTAFDYYGHGQSSPHKCDEYGTIGRWYEDA
eukprot:2342688-Ditylum_brightwellii.AAC.1